MAQKRRKFSPEFRDEAVKMVVVESRPIAEVAREIQVNEGTLGTWVSRYRQEHAGEEPPLNISERASPPPTRTAWPRSPWSWRSSNAATTCAVRRHHRCGHQSGLRCHPETGMTSVFTKSTAPSRW
ncbi:MULTISPECIES: transposase [unclassified Streptomyces]|uniref:transposase n=1 Tax=unclassified Streptomyces TaxID=2593676 RepID=UPI00338E346A